MIVSIFLRFWNIGAAGLSGDESVYAAQALILSGDNELTRHFVLVSRPSNNLYSGWIFRVLNTLPIGCVQRRYVRIIIFSGKGNVQQVDGPYCCLANID
jgi:hypothetical protein